VSHSAHPSSLDFQHPSFTLATWLHLTSDWTSLGLRNWLSLSYPWVLTYAVPCLSTWLTSVLPSESGLIPGNLPWLLEDPNLRLLAHSSTAPCFCQDLVTSHVTNTYHSALLCPLYLTSHSFPWGTVAGLSCVFNGQHCDTHGRDWGGYKSLLQMQTLAQRGPTCHLPLLALEHLWCGPSEEMLCGYGMYPGSPSLVCKQECKVAH
jgi:hypothetical protein